MDMDEQSKNDIKNMKKIVLEKDDGMSIHKLTSDEDRKDKKDKKDKENKDDSNGGSIYNM